MTAEPSSCLRDPALAGFKRLYCGALDLACFGANLRTLPPRLKIASIPSRRARRARGTRGAELAPWLLFVGRDARRASSEARGSRPRSRTHQEGPCGRTDEPGESLARAAPAR